MTVTQTITFQLPSLHNNQRAIWDDTARFQVISAGRRFGKSRLASLRCVVAALQGRRAWWVFPSYPMAAVGWRMLKRLAVQIPGANMREVDRLIEFPSSGAVQIRSADNPDSLRGESLDELIMDEAAFMREEAWTEALRPTLSDRKGRAVFISTPKGRNWFWRIWQLGQTGDPDWQSWQFPTTSNPFIDPNEIEAARRNLPERIFAQEYLAEFIEDGGGVFRRVMEAAVAEPEDVADETAEYLIGADWGKLNDFTALAVLNTTARRLVYLDRFNQIDYSFQLGRLQALYGRFRPVSIIAESNSMGEPLIEQLRRMGMPVQAFATTNASKSAAIEGLALAFEQGALSILNDPVLVGELLAYEMERLPGGLIRYGAPAGMHDDTVMALALAWSGIGRRVEFAPSIWG